MRIYTSVSDPLDFCRDCFPKTEEAAYEQYGGLGDGPDERGNCFGYETEHPAYDCDEEYHCATCRQRLTEADD